MGQGTFSACVLVLVRLRVWGSPFGFVWDLFFHPLLPGYGEFFCPVYDWRKRWESEDYSLLPSQTASGNIGCLSKQTWGTKIQFLTLSPCRFKIKISTVCMKPKLNMKAISPIKLTSAGLVLLCPNAEGEAGESLPQEERQRRILWQRSCSYLLALLMLRYQLQVPWERWQSSLAPLPVSCFSTTLPVLCSPIVLCSSFCGLCFCPHIAICSSLSFLPCSLHPGGVFSKWPCSSQHGIRGCSSLSSSLQVTPHPCTVTAMLVAWPYGELVQGGRKAVAGLIHWAVTQTAHAALLADCWGWCKEQPISGITSESKLLSPSLLCCQGVSKNTDTNDLTVLNSCFGGTDAQGMEEVLCLFCTGLVPNVHKEHPSADMQAMGKRHGWWPNFKAWLQSIVSQKKFN